MKNRIKNLPNTIGKMVESEKGFKNFIFAGSKKVILTLFILLITAITIIIVLFVGGWL